MAGFSMVALQKGIYAKLTGDATLMGMITGVYDYVPENAALPYLSIGDGEARDWPMKGAAGMEHLLEVHVWSAARGRKPLLEIMERVHALLHEGALSLTGHALVHMRVTRMDTELTPDGIVRHGRMFLRAVVA